MQIASQKINVYIYPPPEGAKNPYLYSFLKYMSTHPLVEKASPFSINTPIDHKKKNIIHLQWIPAMSLSRFKLSFKNEHRAIKEWIIRHCKYLALLFRILLLKIFYGIKVVWTIHDAPRLDVHPTIMKILRAIHFFISDAYVVHAKSAINDIPRRYLYKPIIFCDRPNFIGQYGPEANEIEKDTMRQKLGLLSSDITFLVFGHMRKYKNLSYIVDAFYEFHEFSKIRKGVKLLVMGEIFDKEVWDEISKKVKNSNCDCIILKPGIVPDEDIRLIFGISDFVIIGQERGYTSAVMFLAMSYSKPVLIRDWGAALHYIKDGKNGFFFNWNTLPAVLEKAVHMRKDEAAYQRICNSALETMRPLTWHNMIECLIPFYKTITGMH
jgi:glycosyltransferase involved in cell wall biosynthesis